jgi:DNA-binding PadR family transcriptional regulator
MEWGLDMYHFFEHEHRARFVEKGDLKYIILDLLSEKPSHGYEIIRGLEKRFHGFYSPSAGSVYPTLQLLEDMGYIKAAEQDGKKVYSITDEGKKFLRDREETTDRIKGRMRDWWHSGQHEDMRDIIYELRSTGVLLAKKYHNLKPERLARIKEVVNKATGDIRNIIEERD